jgi:hypothetical protein
MPTATSSGRGGFSALEPYSRGVYVNFTSDHAAQRVRRARHTRCSSGPRLTALKAKYDPTNVFRMNANIPAA